MNKNEQDLDRAAQAAKLGGAHGLARGWSQVA